RLETPFDVSITRPQLLRKKIILVHRLLQRKEMLGAPVACQSLGDRGLIMFAALITVGGQQLGVAFTCEDRPDDRHARLARDITDHLGQLEMHLLDPSLRSQVTHRPTQDGKTRKIKENFAYSTTRHRYTNIEKYLDKAL